MAQRGRKSAASLAVVPLATPAPPSPLPGLTEEQAAVWDSIVRSLPYNWFAPSSYDLLGLMCRHVVTARVIWGLIDKVDTASLTTAAAIIHFDRLSRLAEREGKMIAMLGTKLRLTNQSRYDPKTAFRQTSEPRSSGLKPWEKHGPAWGFVP
jgi:hypothetical protein